MPKTETLKHGARRRNWNPWIDIIIEIEGTEIGNPKSAVILELKSKVDSERN